MCIFSLACAAYTWYISEHNHRWFYLYINQDIPLPYQLYLKALWKHSCDILLQTDRQWCWLFLASFLDLSKACDECAFECSTNDRRASRGRNWSEYTEEVHSILQEVRYASHDEEDLWSCKKNRITLYLWTCVSFAVNVAHDSRQRRLRSWRTDMCWWGMELVNMKEKQAKKSLYPSQSGIDFCLERKNITSDSKWNIFAHLIFCQSN